MTEHLYSVEPREGQRGYLAAQLPVYIRTYSHHQSRVCTWTAYRTVERPERAAYWFLVPHTSVIARTPIADDTETIDVATGATLTIDGTDYLLLDDAQLDNPYLVEFSGEIPSTDLYPR